MATKDHCELCEKPDEINYRLETAEGDIKDLDNRFRVSKKEIFEKMEQAKTDMNSKLEKFNTRVIATLTATVISLLLLVINLIAIYGGR